MSRIGEQIKAAGGVAITVDNAVTCSTVMVVWFDFDFSVYDESLSNRCLCLCSFHTLERIVDCSDSGERHQ